MNAIGIAATALFCGLFLALLLGGLGLLIWLAFRIRKENAAILTDTKAVFESAKSSFVAIRNETKAILDEQRKQTVAMLEDHRVKMQVGIDKINAEALIGAAARAIQACMRLEKAVGVIQQLFLDTEGRVTNEYGPEEYAPETMPIGGPPSSYSVGAIAALDVEAERVQDETVTTQE